MHVHNDARTHAQRRRRNKSCRIKQRRAADDGAPIFATCDHSASLPFWLPHSSACVLACVRAFVIKQTCVRACGRGRLRGRPAVWRPTAEHSARVSRPEMCCCGAVYAQMGTHKYQQFSGRHLSRSALRGLISEMCERRASNEINAKRLTLDTYVVAATAQDKLQQLHFTLDVFQPCFARPKNIGVEKKPQKTVTTTKRPAGVRII